jgi:hypothetical protein
MFGIVHVHLWARCIIVGGGVGSGYECEDSEECEVVGRETLNVMGDPMGFGIGHRATVTINEKQWMG